jgi:NAD(P)-dependent dehydrogenase (short-subunit alcohol dehydrogenase family)
VTGGGGAIGSAVARSFAADGWDAVVVGRTRETLEATGFDWFVADVRDAERLEELAASLEAVDALVNCAGGQFVAGADDISANGWRAVVETNLTGTWNACRAFRRALAAGSGGAIVNVVANVWQRAAPGLAHAGAARAGVVSLTRTLAVEWAPEIRVNALSPGLVDTPALRAYGGDVDAAAARTPLARLGTVDEMAAAVRYLIDAPYVTGAVLVADGGLALA